VNGAVGQRRGGGAGRPRGGRSSTLAQAPASLLKDKTMSVTDLAEAVRRAGYKTNSSNFLTIVNAAVLKEKGFKRSRGGQYTAR
jgi:hypothetical protein